MLNGAHSLLAYLGYIGGYEYIRDVMDDAGLAGLARRQMHAAAATLDPVPGIDLDAYAEELTARFANKAIAHRTYQIAMDGTQKLPQRLLEPAMETLAKGGKAETYAIAVAAWIARQERIRISERVRSGLERARSHGTRSGKSVGRPRVVFRRDQVVELRNQGISWRQISKTVGVGVTTVRRAYQSMKAKQGVPKSGE